MSHRPDTDRNAMGDPGETALTAAEKATLLRLARRSLHEYVAHGTTTEYRTQEKALLEPRASFVTLTRHSSGDLRGCRGECPARRPLVDSVMHMAIASATDDPRFPPVGVHELRDLHIEISVLTPLEPIEPDAVVVGTHGLAIMAPGTSGLLLPQVPVQHGWDRKEFLSGLCRKAGLTPDGWRDADCNLYGFEADVWGEDG